MKFSMLSGGGAGPIGFQIAEAVHDPRRQTIEETLEGSDILGGDDGGAATGLGVGVLDADLRERLVREIERFEDRGDALGMIELARRHFHRVRDLARIAEREVTEIHLAPGPEIELALAECLG